jgi:VWFA-related protein
MRFLTALLSLICLAAQEPVSPPAADPTFKTGTTQVLLDVLVANERGPVTGLSMADFVVTDEGQPVRLNLSSQSTEPLNILLLLDASGSMKSYLDQMAKRARSILSELRADDKVGVMAFSKESDYLMPFTSNMDRAANAIDQALRPGFLPSGTAINSALLDSADAFLENKKLRGHRAVFILTDNKALNYRATDAEVLEKLFRADAVLNSIVTKNAEPPKPMRPGVVTNPDFSWADVFKLSAETGGEVLRTDRADEAFARLLSNLRLRYLLSYDAPAAAASTAPGQQFRRVQVSLTKAAQKKYGKCSIRVRAGYYR